MSNIEENRISSDGANGRKDDASQALNKALKRLELIYRNTSVSTWDFSIKARRISQSINSIRIHGFDSVIENVPDSLIECGYVHPDSAKAFRAMYERLFDGEEYAEGIFRVQTYDRLGYRYEHIRYTMITDEDGNPDIAVGVSTDVSQAMELKLKTDSDYLTDLLNHGAFMSRATGIIESLRGESAFLFLLDLNHFKKINDNFGHMRGDIVLSNFGRQVSSISEKAGNNRLCGRIGGDEFAVLVWGCDRSFADALAKEMVTECVGQASEGIRLSVKAGVAEYPENAGNLNELYLCADKALYSVKHNSKTRYCFYGEKQKIEQIVSERRQFLADTAPGGMMGGYIEKGFPFYFIDEGMLRWLGYESEDEFVTDNGGYIDNCMHPDDRAYVEYEVDRQLTVGNRYTVDYRMRKKDGSYIWVHDIGEKTIAPDGREAIISACYDISAEKENNNLLNNLLEGIEASGALYRLEDNGTLTMIHASGNFMKAFHYSDDELRQMCKSNAAELVYASDRKAFAEAVSRSVRENTVVTEYFRLSDKNKNWSWVTGIISRFGNDDGLPVIRIVYIPVSMMNELQLQMLDSKYVGVYVIDEETNELYYANHASLQMLDIPEDTVVTGKTCHELFFKKTGRCDFCWRNFDRDESVILSVKNGKTLSIEAQKRDWNNRHIAVVYCRDITEQHELQQQQHELLNYIPAGISLFKVVGEDIRPVYVSTAVEKMLGINMDVLLKNQDNASFFHCVHPDDLRGLTSSLINDVKNLNTNGYYRYRCWNQKLKKYIWIELHTNIVKKNDGVYVYATYHDMSNANRLQEELEENRLAMESVVYYGRLSIWRYDLDSGELCARSSLKSAYGYEQKYKNVPDSLIENGFIDPKTADEYRSCYERIQKGASISDCIVRILDMNSNVYVWMHIYLVRQKDTADGKRCALGFGVNVDNELNAVKELEKTKSELEARLRLERDKLQSREKNLKHYYVADLSQNNLLEYKSDFMEQPVYPTDMTAEEYILKCGEHIAFKSDYERVMRLHDRTRLIEKFNRGIVQEEYETQLISPRGTIIWTNSVLHLLKDPSSGDILLYEYVYDISEERMLHDLVRVENTYGSEGVGHLLADKGKIVLFRRNPRSQSTEIRHMQFSGFVESRIADRMHPDDREAYRSHCKQVINQAKCSELTHTETLYRTIETDGGVRYHKEDTYLIDREKRIYLINCKDYTGIIEKEIAEKKRLEEALTAAEIANRAKTDFLSCMSHDIRTPLNGILGMTEIAITENRDPKVQTDLEIIQTSGRFLLSLINDILDISRIESGRVELHPTPMKLEVFDGMVKSVVLPLMREKNITFDYNIDCGPQCVFVDEVRFNQIFFNLLSNAAKFTQNGGHVSFFAVKLPSEDDTVEWVRFSVKDNGVGMTEDFVKKAFEPFEQMNEHRYSGQQRQGTGLGLAIVRELVNLMGGRVSLNSRLGEGSEFIVDLPLKKCLPSDEERCPSQTAYSDNELNGRHVLMAEDNEINILVAKRLLENKGVRVTVATNGEQALSLFETSVPNIFDAILMDVRMPVMDGLEATRRIRAVDRPDAKDVPIIAMTANAFDEDVGECKSCGMNSHLSKPIEPERLYQVLALCISARSKQ